MSIPSEASGNELISTGIAGLEHRATSMALAADELSEIDRMLSDPGVDASVLAQLRASISAFVLDKVRRHRPDRRSRSAAIRDLKSIWSTAAIIAFRSPRDPMRASGIVLASKEHEPMTELAIMQMPSSKEMPPLRLKWTKASSRFRIRISRSPKSRPSTRPCDRRGFLPDRRWRPSRRRLRPMSGANMRSRFPAARSACCLPSGPTESARAHEVIASPYSFRETVHAISIAGAKPVFADIDYWAGTLVPEKVEARITEKTRAIVAGNNNGHPAQWSELRARRQEARPGADRGFHRSDRLDDTRARWSEPSATPRYSISRSLPR